MPSITENRPEAISFAIRLLAQRRQVIDDGWTFDDVFSSFWRLYWNVGGRAKIAWDGGDFLIRDGAVHLVPAWFRFSCRNLAPGFHGFIHFEMTGVPGFIQQRAFPRPYRLDEELACALAREWMEAHESGSAGATGRFCLGLALANLSISRVCTLLTPTEREELHVFQKLDLVLRPALEAMETQYARPLNNAGLARACGMSEDYFIRRFREETGVTPHAYLMYRRVREAARLLVATRCSIEEIAEACGFSDRFHFSRTFAREMGRSPARYRRDQTV